jgi:hypothetical protein
MKHLLIVTIIATLFAFKTSAQTKIAAKEASKHIGETVMICDKVYSTKMKDTGFYSDLNSRTRLKADTQPRKRIGYKPIKLANRWLQLITIRDKLKMPHFSQMDKSSGQGESASSPKLGLLLVPTPAF